MKYSNDVATVDDRLPNQLINHLSQWGFWDGVCRVNDDPPNDDPPTHDPPTPEPPANGGDDGDEIGPLKRAYERTKEELKKLRSQAKRAEILDQLEAGGISADDLPNKLAQLKAQEEQEQALERKLAEKEASYRRQREEIEQQYLQQLSERDRQIAEIQKERQFEELMGKAGANVEDAYDFKAIASRFIEFDEGNQIKAFKKKDGSNFYVEDAKTGEVRPATEMDFIVAARKGEYGAALQTILPAYNQSSGSGISAAGGIGSDGLLTFTQAEVNSPEWPANLSPDKMAKVRAKQYRVI